MLHVHAAPEHVALPSQVTVDTAVSLCRPIASVPEVSMHAGACGLGESSRTHLTLAVWKALSS